MITLHKAKPTGLWFDERGKIVSQANTLYAEHNARYKLLKAEK